MKTIKTLAALAAVVLSGLTAFALESYNGVQYSTSSTEINPGEWNDQFTFVKAKAEAEGCPLVVFWGNGGCGWCKRLEHAFADKKFTDWQKGAGSGMGAGILFAFDVSQSKWGPGTVNWKTQASEARNFSSSGGGYPYVAYYWPGHKLKKGDKEVDVLTETRHLPNDNTAAGAETMIAYIESVFNGFTAHPGGTVVNAGKSDEDRLEAEKDTESVTLKLTRTDAQKKYEVTDTWKVTYNEDPKVLASGTVEWKVGQTEGEVVIKTAELFPSTAKDGDTLTVTFVESRKTVTITYVAGNSASNPLWLGERTAPALEFGEWTMDLDVATQKVAATEGAYVLCCVQGSKWCPDCANVERNFLDLEDEFGKNRFAAWAKEKKLALVAIDIPHFTNTAGDYDSPTLLSRKAYSTTLARNTYTNKVGKEATPTKSTLNKSVFPKETPALSGADELLLEAKMRSGLGYLTRKNVSDTEAAEVLERNHKLVRDMTANGGFNRIEDNKPNRTGVPIFVLLRKNGTVAGRFTKFATTSPMRYDTKGNDIATRNFDAYCRRIEELIKEDGQKNNGEIENNDARTTALTLNGVGESTPTGNNEAKCISHADATDVFRLTGVSVGVLQSISIERAPGETGDGLVVLELQKVKDGAVSVLTAKTNTLERGISMERSFASGDIDGEGCFVAVKAVTSDAGFAVDKAGSTWISYVLKTAMLIEPLESKNTTTIDSGYKTVAIRVKKGEWYYLKGINGGVEGQLEGPKYFEGEPYYQAVKDADTYDVVVELDGSGSITHQLWKPGEVGFAYKEKGKLKSERTVSENVGEVEIPVERTLGASDDVKVHVRLDVENSLNIVTEDGHARYDVASYHDSDFAWGDGVKGTTNHVITIANDNRYDGPCTFVFKITLTEGFATLKEDTFTLKVTENDKKAPGKAVFAAVSHDFAKSGTVYVKASDKLELGVLRTTANDGDVSAEVKTTIGEVKPSEVSWKTHHDEQQSVFVGGVPAGATATVSFKSLAGGLTKGSPNTVKVVSIADDAPDFQQQSYDFSGYVSVAFSNVCKVTKLTDPGALDDVKAGTFKRTLAFSKLSGTLPSGIRAAWDKADGLLLSGVPTKAGSFGPVYYQVTETVSYRTSKNKSVSKKTAGFVTKVSFEVTDPSKSTVPELKPLNATCLKSRTFNELPLVGYDEANDLMRLYGTLNVTIPEKSGKVSAKYISEAGTVSFKAAKSWTDFTADNTFVCELSGSGKYAGYRLRVEALDGGQDDNLVVALFDPNVGKELTIKHSGAPWSPSASAKGWEGYYTVALPTTGVVSEETEGFASVGTGYLTLKMQGSSACNAGKVTWSLMLPNGTTLSGSSTLLAGKDEDRYVDANGNSHDVAFLPIFMTGKTDRFSGLLRILKGAQTALENSTSESPAWRATVLPSRMNESDQRCADVLWRHFEAASAAAAKAGYETEFRAAGAIYDMTEDLGACCDKFYQKNELGFNVDLTNLVGVADGAFSAGENPIANVKVMSSSLTVVANDNPQGLKFYSFSRSTGIVSGSFKLSCESGTKKVDFKGVVLNGWGRGCGCENPTCPEGQYMPFVNGSWYFTDKVKYLKTPMAKSKSTLNAKRGAAIDISRVD